jgi:3-oxoadipate enol-lactonase
MSESTLHVEVAGSGPPIVFSHDGLTDSGSWDAQVDAFAPDHRVIRWDRRGYGRSPRPEAQYSSLDDLVALLREHADAPATLVGCSFGSMVTVHCALEYPDLVGAVVLVGPLVTGLPVTEHFNTRGGRGAADHTASDADLITYWTEDPWFTAEANTAARDRLRTMITASPQNLRPPIHLERIPDRLALGHLGEIGVPTLIVVGGQDIADVHAHSGALEAGIVDSTRVVLAGSGHLPHMEVPDAFNQVLRDFLAQNGR